MGALAMITSTSSEMSVQSTQLEHLFDDAVILCPADAENFRGPMQVSVGENKIFLPALTSPRVAAGTICLNSEQRKFLQVELGERATVNELTDLRPLQSLGKVHLVVSSKLFDFSTPVPEHQIDKILTEFKTKFMGHPMNRGHSIPIKLPKGMVDIAIDDLRTASDTPLSSGVLRESTKLNTTIRTS